MKPRRILIIMVLLVSGLVVLSYLNVSSPWKLQAPESITYMVYDLDYSSTHTIWMSGMGYGDASGSYLVRLTEPTFFAKVKLNDDFRPYIPVDNATHVAVSTALTSGLGTAFIVRKTDMKVVLTCPKVPSALWAAGFDENGDVWFGTYREFVHVGNFGDERQTGVPVFSMYRLHGHCQWSTYSYPIPGYPIQGIVRGLYRNAVWFVAEGGSSLWSFSTLNYTFKNYTIDNAGFPLGGGVIDRTNSLIWVGSNGCVKSCKMYRFDIANGTVTPFALSVQVAGVSGLYGDEVVFTVRYLPAAYLFNPTFRRVTSIPWTPSANFSSFGGNGNQVPIGGKVYLNVIVNGPRFSSVLGVFDFGTVTYSSPTGITTSYLGTSRTCRR